MVKRLDNVGTYEIKTDKGRYAVVIENIKNDTYGNPRYEARIVVLEIFGDAKREGYYYTARYRFSGHYLGVDGESKWIVEQFEKEWASAQ